MKPKKVIDMRRGEPEDIRMARLVRALKSKARKEQQEARKVKKEVDG